MLKIEDSKGSFRNSSRTLIHLFECVDCGAEVRASKAQMSIHSGKCVSCAQKGRPYEAVYNELRNKSRKQVTITYEEFLEIISPKMCHYCGVEVIVNKHVKHNGENLSRAYQIDRKDNSLDYIPGNCVLCCWECNRVKSNVYTYEQMLKIGSVLSEVK